MFKELKEIMSKELKEYDKTHCGIVKWLAFN